MVKVSDQMIVCCGLTPCIQRILEFDAVVTGSVNRARSVTIGIGGKGANVARMLHQAGAPALLVAFAGGDNGRLLEHMLRREGVSYRHVAVEGETRYCQTLVEAGNPESTELVEEMPAITDREWEDMMTLVRGLACPGRTMAVSGKLPAGAPPDGYAQLSGVVVEQGGMVILDTSGEPLLQALQERPRLVKINDVELIDTTGESNLLNSSRMLLDGGAQAVWITRGGQSALYLDRDQALELIPPDIRAVNPVGSGDAVTAGAALALRDGAGVEEMITQGMAWGSANALNLVSGQFHLEDVDRLRSAVLIRPWPGG